MSQPKSKHSIIALPPSGLMGGYLRVMKKTNGITVVVTDKPENILKRISFYDVDSRPIERKLSPKEKKLYLGEIKKDITYFGKSYRRADLQVDISGLDRDQAALKVKKAVERFNEKINQNSKSKYAG